MPISSRYIIEQIKSSGNTAFSEKTICRRITEHRSESSKRSSKKNPSTIELTATEIKKVHDALNILNGLILTTHAGRYRLDKEPVQLELPDNHESAAVLSARNGRR
jgi:hypothetical protein